MEIVVCLRVKRIIGVDKLNLGDQRNRVVNWKLTVAPLVRFWCVQRVTFLILWAEAGVCRPCFHAGSWRVVFKPRGMSTEAWRGRICPQTWPNILGQHCRVHHLLLRDWKLCRERIGSNGMSLDEASKLLWVTDSNPWPWVSWEFAIDWLHCSRANSIGNPNPIGASESEATLSLPNACWGT